ncbi:MAG: hypothetical protein GVY28_13645, partial [Alphaproteobacteria bacterium]|nr:hypothetical protein [Alphaproteobacteria bacterium]
IDRVCDYSSIALAEEDTRTYDGIHFDAATNADLAYGLGTGEGCGHGVAVLPAARATLLGPADTVTLAQPG